MKNRALLLLCFTILLAACKKNNIVTNSYYTVSYKLFDSTYGLHSYYFDSANQIHYLEWDSLYPLNTIVTVGIDTANKYITYMADTFAYSAGNGYILHPGFGYDINSIVVTADSLSVYHSRTVLQQESYNATVKGYKVQ